MCICVCCRPRGAPPGGSSGPERHLTAGNSSVHLAGACQQYITAPGTAFSHLDHISHIWIYSALKYLLHCSVILWWFCVFPGLGSGGQPAVSGSCPGWRLRSVYQLWGVCQSQRAGLCVECSRRSLRVHNSRVSTTGRLPENIKQRQTAAVLGRKIV